MGEAPSKPMDLAPPDVVDELPSEIPDLVPPTEKDLSVITKGEKGKNGVKNKPEVAKPPPVAPLPDCCEEVPVEPPCDAQIEVGPAVSSAEPLAYVMDEPALETPDIARPVTAKVKKGKKGAKIKPQAAKPLPIAPPPDCYEEVLGQPSSHIQLEADPTVSSFAPLACVMDEPEPEIQNTVPPADECPPVTAKAIKGKKGAKKLPKAAKPPPVAPSIDCCECEEVSGGPSSHIQLEASTTVSNFEPLAYVMDEPTPEIPYVAPLAEEDLPVITKDKKAKKGTKFKAEILKKKLAIAPPPDPPTDAPGDPVAELQPKAESDVLTSEAQAEVMYEPPLETPDPAPIVKVATAKGKKGIKNKPAVLKPRPLAPPPDSPKEVPDELVHDAQLDVDHVPITEPQVKLMDKPPSETPELAPPAVEETISWQGSSTPNGKTKKKGRRSKI